MRRHPALQDLSRDHFVALNAVVDVRRVVEEDPHAKPRADVEGAFLALVRGELEDHFEEEEALLLPLLQEKGKDDAAARLRSDHEHLRRGFSRVDQGLDVMWEVAQSLRDHVRWEEDELFEGLQAWLTEEELDTLHAASDRFRGEHAMPVGPA